MMINKITKMTKDDLETMTMFLADGIQEDGIHGLKGYKMNTKMNLDDNQVEVEFKNSAGVSRSFKFTLEAM